jgi:uncharacterized protein (UPF0332 family)
LKKKTEQFLSKAKDAIEAAELLQKGRKVDSAAGRAYYAMFYIAEALLFEKGFEFGKHSGVHTAFGEHFTKTGEMDPKFHRYLLDAFESRLEADYDAEVLLSGNAVNEMIEHAKEFLIAARIVLKTD